MRKQAVLIMMNLQMTEAWLGVIKAGNFAGRIPSGTDALTLPSVTCESESEYPWVAALRLCKEIWGMSLDAERLVWVQTCEQPMDFAAELYEDTSNQTRMYVYGYRCTAEEMATINNKRESTSIYRNGQWVALASIYRMPLDIDQQLYQPLWLMKAWLWICQHALSLRHLTGHDRSQAFVVQPTGGTGDGGPCGG